MFGQLTKFVFLNFVVRLLCGYCSYIQYQFVISIPVNRLTYSVAVVVETAPRGLAELYSRRLYGNAVCLSNANRARKWVMFSSESGTWQETSETSLNYTVISLFWNHIYKEIYKHTPKACERYNCIFIFGGCNIFQLSRFITSFKNVFEFSNILHFSNK